MTSSSYWEFISQFASLNGLHADVCTLSSMEACTKKNKIKCAFLPQCASGKQYIGQISPKTKIYIMNSCYRPLLALYERLARAECPASLDEVITSCLNRAPPSPLAELSWCGLLRRVSSKTCSLARVKNQSSSKLVYQYTNTWSYGKINNNKL